MKQPRANRESPGFSFNECEDPHSSAAFANVVDGCDACIRAGSGPALTAARQI